MLKRFSDINCIWCALQAGVAVEVGVPTGRSTYVVLCLDMFRRTERKRKNQYIRDRAEDGAFILGVFTR